MLYDLFGLAGSLHPTFLYLHFRLHMQVSIMCIVSDNNQVSMFNREMMLLLEQEINYNFFILRTSSLHIAKENSS